MIVLKKGKKCNYHTYRSELRKRGKDVMIDHKAGLE